MAAINYGHWKAALAATESKNNELAWGDKNHNGHQACGRWQEHPSFVQQWAGKLMWRVDWSWNDVFEAGLQKFFASESTKTEDPVKLGMWFHLHGNPGGGWDQEYASRFQEAWNATASSASNA